MRREARCVACGTMQTCEAMPVPSRPNETLWLCWDVEACLQRWAHDASSVALTQIRTHIVNVQLHNDTTIERCTECGDAVYPTHSYVWLRDGATTAVVHYTCYLGRLISQMTEALAATVLVGRTAYSAQRRP